MTADALPTGELETQLDPRHCSFLREDGTQCKGWKVKGEELCAGHLGLGIAEDPEAYGKAGAAASAEVRQERAEERRRTPQEAFRAALVLHAEQLAGELVRIATSGESDADRLRAIEALSSRVLGKPTEKVEHTVSIPRTVEELEQLSDAELDAIIAQAELERGGSLLALPPGPAVDQALTNEP